MSFWNLAGEFAKGFAKGYVNERGVEGTIKDVSDLASKVRGVFAGEDDEVASGFNEDAWDDAINEVQSQIEDGDFAAASNTLIDYYNNFENGVPDFFYYRWQIDIYLAYWAKLESGSKDEYEIRNNLRDFFKEARKYNPEGDALDTLNSLKAIYDECLKTHKAVAKWNGEFKPQIDSARDSKDFNLAIKLLDDYYQRYENNNRDYCYFSVKLDILSEQFFEIDPSDNDLELVVRDIKNTFKKMKSVDCSGCEDQVAQYEEMVNLCNDLMVRQKCGRLSGEGNFVEARRIAETQFTAKRDDYCITISRIASLELIDAVEKKLQKSIVENLLAEAERCMTLAIKAAGEDKNLENRIFSAVNPRIEQGRTYLESLNVVRHEDKSQKNEAEEQYVEEVRMCYADDGEISEREMRLLNKLRISLGISEDRAKELEAECRPDAMSEQEKEYVEELKSCLADGIISDRERRLLDRLRKSLGITEARAKEIEENLKK